MKFYASYTICHFQMFLNLFDCESPNNQNASQPIVCHQTFRPWLALDTVRNIISQRDNLQSVGKRCKNVEVFASNSLRNEFERSKVAFALAHLLLGWRLGQSSIKYFPGRGVTQFCRKINAIILFFPRFLLVPLLKIYDCQKIFLITGKGRSRYLGQHCVIIRNHFNPFSFSKRAGLGKLGSIVRALLQTGKYAY